MRCAVPVALIGLGSAKIQQLCVSRSVMDDMARIALSLSTSGAPFRITRVCPERSGARVSGSTAAPARGAHVVLGEVEDGPDRVPKRLDRDPDPAVRQEAVAQEANRRVATKLCSAAWT